ncbi:MAG: leucine-rich repeat protein [Clostridia bacterium]|nr:leucine-rich repeat protein [Clostridia bacterium]
MEKFFERPKMKVIVISAVSVLLLTVIVITVACLGAAKKDKGNIKDFDDGGSIGAFAEKTEATDSVATKKPSSTKETEENDELIFESNGDGSCTLVGLGSFSGSELLIPAESPKGESVIAISDGAFEGCESLVSITIPATVKKIGVGAFVGCSSLESFSVSSSNTKYCAVGGVLFSKDKTTLVCYPSQRVGKSYLLSTNVQSIAAYAFEELTYLKTILYEGSTTKFYAINVGVGNGDFDSLSVTCNYVPAK